MSASSAELKRLLGLLADTAGKAEQDAYAAGWRDCHAALAKAVSAITDAPVLPSEEAAAVESAPAETSSWNHAYNNGGSHEGSFAN